MKKLLALLLFASPCIAQAPLNLETTANGITQNWAAGGNVTRGQIVKFSGSQVVAVATADTSGAIGVAITSGSQGQSVLISVMGSPLIQVDGACTQGNAISISPTLAGQGHCAATAAGQSIGIALNTLSAAGFVGVQLSPLSSAGAGVTSNVPVTCASSMTFTMAGTFVTDFFVNLNCSVTSSVMAGTLTTGMEAVFTLTQDSTGNRAFAWPANFLNTPPLNSVANGTTVATFQYCGIVGNGNACPANSWQNTDVGPAGAGLTQVSSVPATCTPGAGSPPLQLFVAPFNIIQCTNTNIYTGATAFTSYIDPIVQFGIIQDAKWVTDAVYNSAQTTCGAGTGLPAGTCITISATDPPFVCPGAFPCTSGGDVGKQEFGTKNCIGPSPGQCNKAVPKGTIVEVWDATHAQVSVAANGNSVGTMNNFAWGSAGNGAKLQTMVNFLANNPGTAVAFPCAGLGPNQTTTGGTGALWIDSNNTQVMSVPARANPIGIVGCQNGGTVFIWCPDPGPVGSFNNNLSYLFGNNPYPGTFGTQDYYADLIFWGLGNDTGTNEQHNLTIFNGPAILKNVWVIGGAWNVVNTFAITGITFNHVTAINSGSYAGGNFPCGVETTPNFFQTKLTGVTCGGSNSVGLTINGTVGGNGASNAVIESSYLYGNTAAIYGVLYNSAAPVTMQGNYIGGLSDTGSGILNLIGNQIDRFISNAPFALSNTGTGIINAMGNNFLPQSNAFLNQSSGTFNDLCGNSGMNAPTISGGTLLGPCSNSGGNAYGTVTNCTSSAAPAVCGQAKQGSVVIAAAGTTVTVNTTGVTANSQILVTEDSSLGTKLSVTCNTTTGRTYTVTTRTAATSFVITASAAPATNPACLSYTIVN